MVKISAFQSLRPEKKIVTKLPTKAYSHYSKKEIIKETLNNQYSFLNIISQRNKQSQQKKFENVRKKIDEFKKRNILITDNQNSMYVYRQIEKGQTYTGLICGVSLEDYENGKIKTHEKTIEKRELLFAEYLSITKIYADPVLITYDDTILKNITEKYILNKNKIYDFKTSNNTQHQIWHIKENEDISEAIKKFEKIKNLYIADGHHRMASSLRNNKHNMCLAYILPKKELRNYPFHRIVSINKKTKNIVTKIKQNFIVKDIRFPLKNTEDLQFYINNKWYRVTLKNNLNNNIVENLLVSKLLKNILEPFCNIKDERKNKNVNFMPGNQSIKDQIAKTKSGEILFLMNKINIETIIKIADNNYTMPPKSTFILPKMPSGLIMMELK